MLKTPRKHLLADKPVVPLNQGNPHRLQKGSMILLDGEITEINTPPNKADQFRELTIWVPETGEHVEMTCFIHELKKSGLEEGSKISIKIEKKFDVDSLTRDLLKAQ